MVQEQPVTKGKILYVGGFELPDRNAAAHRVLNNAKVFRMLGYDTVFCGVDKDIKNAPKEVCGFENKPLSYPKGAKDWFFSLVDISHYTKMLDRYDDIGAVMCYNLHALPLMRLIRVCNKRGIKIAADCTEWYENKPSLHPVKMIKCIDTALAMRAQKKLDGMIAISSYLEGYYKPFVPAILRLPPLVDVTDPKWTQKVPAKDGRLKLVYSGSPGDTKDKLGQIVRLLSGFDADFEFKVVGVTKEEFLSTFESSQDYVSLLGDRIVFAGRVSHTDSIKALYEADYCVFVRDCTRKNTAGFPTKFVECFTSGVGIIASDISDIKEYFPMDSVSILAKDSTDESIAAALKTVLYKNVDEIRNNRRNGLCDNPFDINVNTQKIERLISDLAMTKKKILLTLRIGGENGGPYISHSRMMQSALKDKYIMKPLMVPRSRVLLDPRGMKALVNTIKAEKPELVVVTGLQIDGFLAALACKKAGVKYLLAVHGSSREALDIGEFSKSLVKMLENHSIRNATAVFGVSDYVSGWDCLKRAKKHCGTVYNIPSLCGDRVHDLRDEFGFSDKDTVIVSTGRITRDKGYDLLWQSIQKLGHRDNVKFLIAGDGNYRQEWQKEITQKGYDDMVVLAGYRSDIDAVLNTADIFIICTKHETLCNSILEAYMHSLPVIATNVGGIPEIVSDGKSGMLITNGDVDGFSAAIEKLVSDPELCKQYGSLGREIVYDKFDESKIVDKLDRIFTELTD